MKGLLIFVMAVGMMFAVMGANTVMADEGGNTANQICKKYNDLWYDNHGQCVSDLFIFGRSNDGPVVICKWLQDKGIVDKLGPCVSFFRTMD